MAIKIFIVLLFVSFNGYAQMKDTVIIMNQPTPYLYDYQKFNQDSIKYYYKKYLALKHKGVPDSINHWYWMLKKLKK